MQDEPIISFEHVSFAYGESGSARSDANTGDAPLAQQVLRDVSFSVVPGEFVTIMGNNGSGKSTLAMLLCAFLQPGSGTVCVLGHDTQLCSPFELRQHIGLVMQNPDDQLVASIVENEVAFGPENLGLPVEYCQQRIAWALSKVALSGFEKRKVNSLSGGQKQRVAIAGALAMRPDVLVLDEATSMLDEQSRAKLVHVVRSLANAGTTIVMITHSIADAQASDRVLALKEGRIVLDDTPERAFADGALQRELGWNTKPFIRTREGLPYAGRSFETPSDMDIADIASALGIDAMGGGRHHDHEDPLVELRDVSFSYEAAENGRSGESLTDSVFALRNINLHVFPGELLAIVGPTGSGKSTLIQLMNGLLWPTEGTVLIRGEALRDKHAANIARSQVGLVFQYPEQQMFTNSVYDEIAFGPRNLGLSADETDARVREALDAVGLPFEAFAKRNPFTLSGGEQRRVAIASVLSMRPHVLILDEPCAGLDPPTHLRFLQLLCQLNDAGQTIVMVSHEMADVHAIATRVVEL